MTLDHMSTAAARHLGEADLRLARVQQDREEQLQATPANTADPATTAYRGNLEATLREIRAARSRVASGDYGTCVRCAGAIAEERLDLRPWALTCTPCASME